MMGVTTLFAIYNVVAHTHDHPRTDLPYMKYRSKPYPWKECADCNIFDPECWKKCRGEGAEDGEEESHH